MCICHAMCIGHTINNSDLSVPDPSTWDGRDWAHLRFLLFLHQDAGVNPSDCKWHHRNGLSPGFSIATDWIWQSLHYVVLSQVFDMLKGAASRSIVTVVSPMITNMPDHTLHNHDYIPWGQIECWRVLDLLRPFLPKGLVQIFGYCRRWLLSTCA